MTQTVYGAVVAILLDVGIAPFMLDRDILDDVTAVLNDDPAALTDLSNPVLSVNATHGARDPRGILTDVESGTCTISVYDPERELDPANAAKAAILVEGAHMQVTVGGNAVFTGYIDTIEHTLAGEVTTFVCQDAIPRLSGMNVVLTLPAGSTFNQVSYLMDAIGWTDKWVMNGSTVAFRDEDPIVMSAWAALQRIRDAELGDLWIDRFGSVAFRARGDDTVATAIPDVGDSPGIPLLDIISVQRRVSVVNHVAVDMTEPTPDREWSVATGNRRSYAQTQADLLLIEPV